MEADKKSLEFAKDWLLCEVFSYDMSERDYGELRAPQRDARRALSIALDCVREIIKKEEIKK